MKNFTQKLIGLLTLVFAMSFTINAQEITPSMFVEASNTGSNETIGFNWHLYDLSLDSFEGGQIGAFYDLNGDGELQSVGLESVTEGFFSMALWGDDYTTPEVDGLPSSAIPQFAMVYNGVVIYFQDMSGYSGYTANGFWDFQDALLTDEFGNQIFGCANPSSCDYDSQMIYDDGSCVNYPEENYDCFGNCVNDSDGDGVCNENEIIGCLDPDYVEYNPLVTDAEENSCLTTWQEAYFSQVGEIFDLQNLNDNLGNELENISYQLDTLTDTYQALLEAPQCEEIIIDIQEGWNIFGYTSSQVLDISDVMAAFSEYIYIIKDNNGAQYWGGDVNYNGIGDFIPGEGYQIKAFAPFSISFEN